MFGTSKSQLLHLQAIFQNIIERLLILPNASDPANLLVLELPVHHVIVRRVPCTGKAEDDYQAEGGPLNQLREANGQGRFGYNTAELPTASETGSGLGCQCT